MSCIIRYNNQPLPLFSPGPLVCEIAGAWTLVGITSWGVGCSYTRKYGIYTDIGSMKPWLDIVMRENQYL